VIIPDVNLLVYAYMDAVPQHRPARAWWESLLNGKEEVGLAPLALFGFVRLCTNRRIFESPLATSAAVGYVKEWLAAPRAQLLASGPRHVELALGLVEAAGAGGNLTTDAQLAAHGLELQATVASNDVDFGRFPGLRWVNPLAKLRPRR
jgi:toxin-antitoxin system PIN domain toxin